MANAAWRRDELHPHNWGYHGQDITSSSAEECCRESSLKASSSTALFCCVLFCLFSFLATSTSNGYYIPALKPLWLVCARRTSHSNQLTASGPLSLDKQHTQGVHEQLRRQPIRAAIQLCEGIIHLEAPERLLSGLCHSTNTNFQRSNWNTGERSSTNKL